MNFGRVTPGLSAVTIRPRHILGVQCIPVEERNKAGQLDAFAFVYRDI